MTKPWPIIIAAADCLAIVAYVLDVEPYLAQAVALAIKALASLWTFREDSIAVAQFPFLLALAFLCLLSTILGSQPSFLALAQTIGFNIHLFLTLLLIINEVPVYFKAISYITSAASLLYLAYAAIGLIPIIWGRHFYFNGNHPNLGAEIATAGVLCGVLVHPLRQFLLLSIPQFFAAYLMQGRSALLTISLVVLLRLAREFYVNLKSRRTQLLTVVLTPFVIVSLVFAAPLIFEAMQLDSEYRGVASGLGGRDAQWMMAWTAFLNKPLTGQGLGWIQQTQEMGAHQFFLYGLAEMGLLSLLIFFAMFVLSARAVSIHGWKIVPVAPVLIMMFVNDRFMNLNLYPFILWLFILSLSARKWNEA